LFADVAPEQFVDELERLPPLSVGQFSASILTVFRSSRFHHSTKRSVVPTSIRDFTALPPGSANGCEAAIHPRRKAASLRRPHADAGVRRVAIDLRQFGGGKRW